jgi:hypothetical protein
MLNLQQLEKVKSNLVLQMHFQGQISLPNLAAISLNL